MIEYRTLPLTALKPAPYNPRVELQPGMDAYRRLKRSLDEFGLVQPIVWNERTGHVVGGHQRLTILRNEGLTEVAVAVVSLSPEREKALNVALNNDRVAGDWDPDRLLELLDELNELPDFDATLTGFDPDALNDLLLSPAETAFDEPDTVSDDRVRVQLVVPSDDWDDVRPAVDQLVREHGLELHVTWPESR